MIIWLASYPRAGNSLLGTIMNLTMGLKSTDSEEPDGTIQAADNPAGRVTRPKPWPEFYEETAASRRVHLIKTHLYREDSFPAIHIVRDGRLTLYSYCHFLRETRQPTWTLAQTILGDVGYGDWTHHHRQWSTRTAPYLQLRFEELVCAGPVLLRRIADFAGYRGPIGPWNNPFAANHKRNPRQFREGASQWQGKPEWTAAHDWLFEEIHGQLMNELGYQDNRSVPREPEPALAEWLLAASDTLKRLRQVMMEREHAAPRWRPDPGPTSAPDRTAAGRAGSKASRAQARPWTGWHQTPGIDRLLRWLGR